MLVHGEESRSEMMRKNQTHSIVPIQIRWGLMGNVYGQVKLKRCVIKKTGLTRITETAKARLNSEHVVIHLHSL